MYTLFVELFYISLILMSNMNKKNMDDREEIKAYLKVTIFKELFNEQSSMLGQK